MKPAQPSRGAALLGASLLAMALLLISGLGWLSGTMGAPDSALARPSPLRPAPTAEPLVPTPLPAFRATRALLPSATAIVLPLPSPIQPPQADGSAGFPFGGSARTRVGVGFPIGFVNDYDWGAGLPGWWLAWQINADAPALADAHFAQMVRIQGDRFRPELAIIQQAARLHPGALWLIGNEPDVAWQDNATPEQYAASYDILHTAIKAADPSALVAIAGVSQPTPMRLDYLDRILAAYQAQSGSVMPVDVWNIHAFILREERGAWGVGIPPGIDINQGALYEITDHDDMRIFKQQIVDFRKWMAQRGFRDAPLIVSEYGVLMPASYGFPANRVADFLIDTFDFFLTARDPQIGYPADEGRLVQAFCWYSAADTVYPTSNLFDPKTGSITPVGEMFRAYVHALP